MVSRNFKRVKCHFMHQSVDYPGYKIDAEGLHAASDKVEAIANAPSPKDWVSKSLAVFRLDCHGSCSATVAPQVSQWE